MDWKKYENVIYDLFKRDYPDSEITLNTKKRGKYSKTDRQIDILLEDYVAGNRITIVIDGKYFNRKIDVKCVESFIGMLEDIDAHKGLLVSQKGYSKAAINRAYHGPSKVELDVLNFSELRQFQGLGAFPYSGAHGALIGAPFGWVIDAERSQLGLATLYERGLTIEKAISSMQFMYVQIWYSEEGDTSLEVFLKNQENDLKEVDPKVEISFLKTIRRNDAEVVLRRAVLENYPTPEYTGIVKFKDFVFFCVLFTPEEFVNKNIRKLENILMKVLPINVKHEDADK